jgi:LPXTG-motif cell wall-anchored protein
METERTLKKIFLLLTAVLTALLGGMAFAALPASATSSEPTHKVTLCHRTGSVDGGNLHNGYSIITVDISAASDFRRATNHEHHEQVGNGPGPDIIPAFEVDVKKGKETVHYTYPGANLDYVFTDGTTGAEFLTNGCHYNTPPEDEVTKVNVQFFDPTCKNTEAGILVQYDQTKATADIDGAVKPGETVTVTFKAKDGFVIEGQKVWTHTYGEVPTDCGPPPEPTSVNPNASFMDPTCENPKLADVHVKDIEGVDYGMVGEIAPDSTVTVTATAKDGFVIDGKSKWTHTFADSPTKDECDTGVTPPPRETNPPAELPHTGGSAVAATLAAGLALLTSGSGIVAWARKR